MGLETSFNQISPTRRIPLFIAEFQKSGRNQSRSYVNPTIILAQKLPGGSATVSTPYRITSSAAAADLFGVGSPAHLMCKAFLRNHPTGELWCAVQTDAGGATAAAQTLTYTGPASAAGAVYLYIGGVRVQVAVADGDTAAEIATATVAAITAITSLPVTAAVGGGGSEHIVTMTDKVKGTVGNQVPLALNPLGQQGGQVLPTGVVATLGAALLAGGATDPAEANWVTSLANASYDTIILQFDDATAVDEIKTELQARWNANRARDGFLVTAKADSHADLITYAEARNYENQAVFGYKEASSWLTPAYEIAAMVGAVTARKMAIDPASPIHFQPLIGAWPNGLNFTDAERDQLANAGVATLVARGGSVYIEFEATTRRLDEGGDEDHTYDVLQTPYTLSRVRRRLGGDIESAYPEHKLVDDDTSFGEGQKIVTCRIIKGFIAGRYRQYVTDGLVENYDDFVANMIVERDPSNANRVNGYLPADLANQFRVFAGIVSFTV